LGPIGNLLPVAAEEITVYLSEGDCDEPYFEEFVDEVGVVNATIPISENNSNHGDLNTHSIQLIQLI